MPEHGQGYCLHCGTPLEARRHEDRDRPTCPSCGFIHYLDPKIAVAVILGDEHGVLLGRRCIDPSSGLWSFPAGYVNRGEVLEEAAVREVLEEFGVAGEVGVELHGQQVGVAVAVEQAHEQLARLLGLLSRRAAAVDEAGECRIPAIEALREQLRNRHPQANRQHHLHERDRGEEVDPLVDIH